jgi:hypothetical protein
VLKRIVSKSNATLAWLKDQTYHYPNFEPGFDIETQFTDRFGNNCGRKRIRFLSVTENRVDRYLVDDSDLTDLLSLIGTCATRTANNP